MDSAVKESVEIIIELLCAGIVIMLLSFAVYAEWISPLIERLC